MKSAELLDYLRSQRWFFGIRADASLLFYSCRQEGIRKHVKKMHGLDFAETLLVPIEGKPVRVMNLGQAKKFHEVSRKMVVDNPRLLEARVKEDDGLWLRIACECEVLDSAVKAGDVASSLLAFKRIAESYALNGAYFIIVFSLGLKLTEAGETPATAPILRVHDVWRNAITSKEERLGESWLNFFEFLALSDGLKSSALDLMRFLSLPEILTWLDQGDFDVDAVVGLRKRQGFIYLDLRDDRRVIDDGKLIAAVSAHFTRLIEKEESGDGVQGQTAFAGAGRIAGEIVVVKDKDSLAAKGNAMAGKILVAVQTTPHYIPFLKNAKAIITDEGGITCHAAIVARELKKPCIVGTRVATQVLKDGDEVEVDTGKGSVRIIRRAGSRD